MTDQKQERLSLLVVDDDAVDRAAVKRALRGTDLDVEVMEVADAPEALEALRRGGHDCALLDFRLPRGDGLALLRAARSEGLQTPIVVLTGQGDETLAVEIMKAGALDYLAKNAVTPDRLRQSIVQAVRVRRAEVVADLERKRLARLHAFVAQLATTQTVTEVAAAVLTEGLAVFDATRGIVALLTSDGDALDIVDARGYPDEAISVWRQTPLTSDAPLTNAVRERELQFVESRAAFDARYPHLREHRSGQSEAVAVIPLVAGRVLGSVALSHERAFTLGAEQRGELLAFGRVCAQAMARAQLFELAQLERNRAEEASRAKDDFLAVVSHELRTPLNAILGWTRLLRTGNLSDSRGRQALEVIERNATAQAQLIEDLLDISRITAGKLRLQLRQFDLHEVVKGALDVVRPAADAKSITLRSTIDDSVGPLMGDPDRLQQVVWNFLTNAVKFTPKGGKVWVCVRPVDSQVEVEVSDTGCGIAPAFLPHVFERFRQAEAGTTRSHSGLGLGLAIVKSLVELHGGTVEARSEGEGRGTTFIARLPVAPIRLEDTRRPSVHPRAPGVAPEFACPPQLASVRVLIVDDEPDGRDLIFAALSECGAEVVGAASAAEALSRLSNERFDVLVSDIGMPGEDGYALIAKVRALGPESGGDMPAVALTAFARGEDRTRALAAGFDVHVAKPVEPAELVLILARLVERRRPSTLPPLAPK
ncbi:MAG TPA: response regulator [Polyangiaceae bacterium]|nr:response regulator [Polyangiaceae bacterium]